MSDLFEHAATIGSRRRDPDTSHQAADRHPLVRGKDRLTALRIHADNPAGLNDFELAERMGRSQTSAGKRRGELRDLGLIAATELRRNAPSGSPAIVWKITADGLNEAQNRSAA